MATVDFLRKMIDKSNLYDRRIRELERRLKRVERDNNPIALFEPGDSEELFGGRLINGCSRNLIQSNIPNGNFQNRGFISKSLAGVAEARCLVKLAVPVNRIDLIGIGFESQLTADRFIIMTGDLADGDSTSGMTANFLVSFISEDFDPTTVTFNNKPATINEIDKNVVIASSSPVTITGGPTQLRIIFDIGRSTDVGFEFAKGKGLVFGLQFRLDGALTGGLTNGLIQGPNIEVDETTTPTIGSRATYIGTIA